MNKWIIFSYGIIAYIIALIGQIWLILYIGEWDFLSQSINASQETSSIIALAIDSGLILLFGLQHSIMARSWFKKWLTLFIPKVAERSTYVLFSGITLILMAYFWQPIDGYVWQVENETAGTLLTFGYLFGWSLSVFATFVINHFELFGLQQVYFYLIGKKEKEIAFTERLLYKYIRHPIQLGVLIGIWFTPTMTYGHLFLSFGLTIYIFIGLYYEEKSLIAELGDIYQEYKKRIGMLFPFLK